MDAFGSSQHGNPEDMAMRAADGLALALEDAGFDVGRTFPSLAGQVTTDGTAVVQLGAVTAAVATRLAEILMGRRSA